MAPVVLFALAEMLPVDGLGSFHAHSHDCLAMLHAALLDVAVEQPAAVPAAVEPPAAAPNFVAAVVGVHEPLVAVPGVEPAVTSYVVVVVYSVVD